MRLLYSIVIYLLTPLAFLYLALRSIKEASYRQRWVERLGFLPPASMAQPLWLHAASLGEVQAVAPLARLLRQRYPSLPLLITTMTPTGSEYVRKTFGDGVHHGYIPFDTPDAVRRFLQRTRPRLAVVMETELWPNLFQALRVSGIPLLIINARLSSRSLRGYRRLRRLTQATIECVSIVAAQSVMDAERYASLGARPQQLVTTGNIKFDMVLPVDLDQSGGLLRAQLGKHRPIWIAASTHEGEDELVLEAHRALLRIYPELLLMLVPRHPERFDRVARLCWEQGFTVARRSLGEGNADTQVYVGDTMGELLRMYAAAEVAFVGGSLVAIGGHNLLEPAALGLLPISGPHLFNFHEVAELLTAADALVVVKDGVALAESVKEQLMDAAMRRAAGERARQVVEENCGALERTLRLIERYL